MPRSPLRAYLATATMGRSSTEAAGPAILLVTVGILGSATTGSYLVAAFTAAAAVFGPFSGAIIDRARIPRRSFAANMVLLAVGLAGVSLTIGRLPLIVALLCAAVAGLGHPAITGAWSAQLPRLIPPDGIKHAYAYDAATYSLAAVVAPPVAAALISINNHAPLWLPIGLVIASLVMLRLVPLAPRTVEHAPLTFGNDLKSGIGALSGIPSLRRSTIITTFVFAGQSAIFVAAPVLSQQRTGSLQFTGAILGVFAAGGVITALWFARHPVQRPDRAIIVGSIITGFMLLGVWLSPDLWLPVAFAFVMGAAEPPIIQAMLRIRAREAPARVQAQVFTTGASIRMASFAVATAACGWVLQWGLAWTFALGVALHLIGIAVGLMAGPAIPPRRQWFTRDAK